MSDCTEPRMLPRAGDEADHLFTVIRKLRDSGRAVVLVSHKLKPAGQLSGGNQQKVRPAKWLAADCDVLIADGGVAAA